MKLEILVTTMNQFNFSKIDEMNIQSDVVIANQSDYCAYDELETKKGFKAIMISTTSKGLSRNRNIALAHSNQSADLIMFLDDDVVLNDNYESIILQEFEEHPEVDAIKFNIHDLSDVRKLAMKRIEKFEKCTRRNMSASGVCGFVIKRRIIQQYGLHFHENFGSGTKNYCGEDTIFLQNLINKHVPLYRSPKDIAGIDQTNSTWFRGFDDKYFYVVGKVFATIYPRLCRLLAIRSSYRFSKKKECNMNFMSILKNYNRGIKDILRRRDDSE